MKSVIGWCLVMMTMTGTAWVAEGDAEQAASYDNYKAIYEKNIFSRNRYTPLSRQGGGAVRKEKVVLSLYVLRGVAVETQKCLAFVEDEISGQFKRLAVGQQLLNGTISEIHVDYVLFAEDEKTRTVRIGQEFDRIESEVERPADEASAGPEPNTPGVIPSPVKNVQPASAQDEDAILKQMLERRRQEMGN